MNNDRLARSYQSPANYPPENDTTSQGGYGPGASTNIFSPTNQRHANPDGNDAGLVSESPSGGPLGSQLQDAPQGTDAGTRDPTRRSNALSPYGRSPDSKPKQETGDSDRLASAYADSRARQYEGSGARGIDSDGVPEA